MKKKLLHVLIAAILFVCLLTFAACGTLKFELSAETESSTVAAGEMFQVTVKTENVGGLYRYKGSSTVIGASAELFLETDGERIRLTHDPLAVSADITTVKIKKGRVIEHEWTFYARMKDNAHLPEGCDLAPKGSYTLKLSYLDFTEIIENFITIE